MISVFKNTFPPPPLHPNATPLQRARYVQLWLGVKSLSPDQVWLLRSREEKTRNLERWDDWQVRFYVLGPRPNDWWSA